jgi:integrase/recombinase XerD
MIHSLSIRFYPNEHKAKGGKCPLYLRITLNRKKSELATTYLLDPKDWDETRQRTKKNTQINEHLSAIENEVYEIGKRLEKEKKPITAHSIKNYLTKKDKLDAYLLEFYEKHLTRLDKAGEVEKETILRYRDTLNYLTQLLKEKKLGDISVESVGYTFITDFDLFLLNKVNKTEKTMERNTVNKHHSRLRTILIRAIREGFIVKNPYVDFKLKNTPSKRTFLSEEELQAIIEHELGENESLKRVRDIFIFSVYTGLRFEDAQQLTMDKITKDKRGSYAIEIRQEKTSEPVFIPLLKPAVNIIKKYEDSPERKVFSKVLPKISNQKLNSYLKVIAELTGIGKTLTHHVARHTCATTILLSNEVPMEVVSKWLGHTNIKTTQIYAKITGNYLQHIASKIEDKIKPPAPKKKKQTKRKSA